MTHDEKIVEAVARAYNAVWDAAPSITAHNVAIVREEALRAAITAFQAEAWQGYKLVPIEPTEAMMDAAIAAVEKPCFPQDIYAAMVEAAPKATP